MNTLNRYLPQSDCLAIIPVALQTFVSAGIRSLKHISSLFSLDICNNTRGTRSVERPYMPAPAIHVTEQPRPDDSISIMTSTL